MSNVNGITTMAPSRGQPLAPQRVTKIKQGSQLWCQQGAKVTMVPEGNHWHWGDRVDLY